jgi:hypothetical protein
MPEGSAIYHVGQQHGSVIIWARIDPEAETFERTFLIVGTGQDIPDGYCYHGTVQIGDFVWHVFERTA